MWDQLRARVRAVLRLDWPVFREIAGDPHAFPQALVVVAGASALAGLGHGGPSRLALTRISFTTSLYLTALLSRFSTTWQIASGSSRSGGSDSANRTSSRKPSDSARGRNDSTAVSNTSAGSTRKSPPCSEPPPSVCYANSACRRPADKS